MELPEGLPALLRSQAGLVTVAQLESFGITRAARRHATAKGWRMVLPGVVQTARSPLSPRQRLFAAQLWAGPGTLIAGATAAAVHGVRAADGEQTVRLLVPAGRRPRPTAFVVVGRTRRVETTPVHRGGLALCSPARAVADAARAAPRPDQAHTLVLEAAQRRIVPVADLRHELEDGPRQGSAVLRAAVQAAEAGAWSVAEVEVASLLAPSAVLPEVMLNPRLSTGDGTALPTPDAWFDDVGLAVQVHSRRHHSAPDDWERTVLSDGVYAEYGVPVVGVTPRFARRDPTGALRRVERAYLAARSRERPDVVATPVGHGIIG